MQRWICSKAALYRADALWLLTRLGSASIDAAIVDPPYCSGGTQLAARQSDPSKKYVQSGQKKKWPEFVGDQRDQRSFAYWCALWGSEVLRAMKPGGYFLQFTDWRQLGATIDAIQAAGFLYRGVIVWNKTERARPPNKAYFRHQCEYLVWGTKVAMDVASAKGPWPGCHEIGVDYAEKQHMTGKPIALMRQLVKCAPRDGLVLDCFAGSASTGVAALLEGRRFIGCEFTEHYFQVGRERLKKTHAEARRRGEKAKTPVKETAQ